MNNEYKMNNYIFCAANIADEENKSRWLQCVLCFIRFPFFVSVSSQRGYGGDDRG